MIFKIADYVNVQSVSEHQLQGYPGYEVLHTWLQDMIDRKYDYNNGNSREYTIVVGQQLMFLIGLREEGRVLEILQNDNLRLKDEARQEKSAREQALRQLEAEKRLTAEAERRYDKCHENYVQALNKVEPLQTAKQKLEQDIAKLRRAIGDLQFKAIVEGQ